MGKFSGASAVQQAQQGQLGGIELPTGIQPQPGQTGPSEPNLLQKVRGELEAAPAQDPNQVAGDIADATLATAEETERFSVPSMGENARAPEQPGIDVGGRWQPIAPKVRPDTNPEATPHGGLMERASAIATNAFDGTLDVNIFLDDDSFNNQPQAAENIRAQRTQQAEEKGRAGPLASLAATLASVNAIEMNPQGRKVPNKSFIAIGSVVTENAMSDLAFGNPDAELEAEVAELEGRDPTEARLDAEARRAARAQGKKGAIRPEKFARETANARIGQEVYKQFQRTQNPNEVPKSLPKREAELLGDFLKEAWYQNGVDPTTGQNPMLDVIQVGDRKYYQLTPVGAQLISKGDTMRKKMLPKTNVLPSKQPLPEGKLPGDVGANEVRSVSGKLIDKGIEKGVIAEAKKNLSTIGHVVDKTRGRLSLVTALPALLMDPDMIADPSNPQAWMAAIHSIGSKKINGYRAKDKKEGTDTVATKVQSLQSDLAQSVRAAATERKGANYLTYYTQAYNGRVAPQQSAFDPTSSKYIRALTRSPKPSVLGVPSKDGTPKTMKEWSLQNMYAMMLVKDADAELPEGRMQKLKAAEGQLLGWASEIETALANSMTEDQYEAVSEAISQGMTLDDPNFPQFTPFELSPELAQVVAKKGEDGVAFMDGLLDFKKYIQARKDGRPFSTYFNATFDGKTNGIASNGIQMGDERVAFKTGVLRSQDQTLLDNNMDIRDDLEMEALQKVRNGGFDHAADYAPELSIVAEEVFKVRDLNKATTMTFGYGMDIAGFTYNIDDTIGQVEQEMQNILSNPESTPDEKARAVKYTTALDEVRDLKFGEDGRDSLAKTLLGPYAEALINVMSEDALKARSVMRSAAAMFAAMNLPFSFKTASGTPIMIGGSMSKGSEGADVSRYEIGGVKPAVTHYENQQTAAAPRFKTDKETGTISETPGGLAFSGSIPGPVQAIDADTVARSFSGKSWQKMKAASGGQPYMHPIYDAFKVDLDGFATALEEVNNNWLDSCAEWSYLEATQKSLREGFMEFNESMKGRGDKDLLSDQEGYYIRSMLALSTNELTGKMEPGNLIQLIRKSVDPMKGEDNKDFMVRTKKIGFNIVNKMGLKDPTKATVGDLKKFVNVLAGELDVKSRLNNTINRTNAKKKELVRKARAKGVKLPNQRTIPGQYWAH